MKFSYKHLFWIALITTFSAFSWSIYAEITKTDIVYDNSLFVEQLISQSSLYGINSNDNDIHPTPTPVPITFEQLDTTWRERIPDRDHRKTNGDKQKAFRSKQQSVRITQWEEDHVNQWNGSMFAIDIVHDDGNAYLPDSHSEYVITHIGQDERIGDYIIIRNDKERWVYGHTVTSRSKGVLINVEKHGRVLGQSNLSGVSTALHTHIERWLCKEQESRMKDCDNVSSTWAIAERNEALKAQRGWVEDSKKEIVEVVPVDLDKLAKAVAMAETTGCTKWTALSKKNCHGIKSWNTYPCKSPKKAMCAFASHEESYEAFKVIWAKWYKTFPTRKQAVVWTWSDNADRWLAHVTLYYNEQ